MREYQMHVFAGYKANGVKHYNCFKEYVEAKNEAEAKRIIKAELKDQGYFSIKLSDIIPC